MHARSALFWMLILGATLPTRQAETRPLSVAAPGRDRAEGYSVKVWLEATEPGSDVVRWLKNDASFRPNDEVVLRLQATKPVYVYVFTQLGEDAATLQVQETSAGSRLVRAGETLRFPARPGVYRMDQTAAREHFKIVARRRPLDAEAAKTLGLPWPLASENRSAQHTKTASARGNLTAVPADGEDQKEETKDEKRDEKKDEKKDSKCDERPGQKGRPPQCRQIQPPRKLPDTEYAIVQAAAPDDTAVVNLHLNPPATDRSGLAGSSSK